MKRARVTGVCIESHALPHPPPHATSEAQAPGFRSLPMQFPRARQQDSHEGAAPRPTVRGFKREGGSNSRSPDTTRRRNFRV